MCWTLGLLCSSSCGCWRVLGALGLHRQTTDGTVRQVLSWQTDCGPKPQEKHRHAAFGEDVKREKCCLAQKCRTKHGLGLGSWTTALGFYV